MTTRRCLTARLSRQFPRAGLRLAGAGLLAAAGGIHLDLYLTGYRSIPVIGWLFLLQVIAAFGLAAAVLATGSRVSAAAGAGFALATLGGYLLSLWIGLFGFKEIRTTAGIVAGVIEIAAFAVLAALTATPGTQAQQAVRVPGSQLLAWLQAGFPGAGPALAGISVVPLVVLGVSVATAGGPPGASTSGTVKTASIGGVTVLTNASGFTLYWFAPDTATKSTCYGTCAGYWPPVTGTPSAARASPASWARSSGQTERPRSSITATRCTPTSAKPPPVRPSATGLTSTAGSGTK